jgi:hypothetical protein
MNTNASIYFAGWYPIARVVVIGVGGYVFLLLAFRLVGPRTMAKTNIFDFIILVSIGSVYGRILTAKDVTLVEALVAYALLVALHYAVSLVARAFEVHRNIPGRRADPPLLRRRVLAWDAATRAHSRN